MSKTNDARKAAQLGMPWGTATTKLRKMLLFRATQKLNEDICFKCGKKIETIGEFTIEHKKSWLHVDVRLFWDLENIAFSHSKCNLRDSSRNQRKVFGESDNRSRKVEEVPAS